MSMAWKFSNLIGLIAALPLSVSAEGWTGKGEAGVALASTNAGTSSKTVNAKFDIAYEAGLWKHALGASDIYGSSDSPTAGRQTTADRWEAHEQSDYKLNERAFAFEALKHESDKIGSFEYQNTATAGLGYKFFDSDARKLSVQVGAGYRQNRERVLPPLVSERTGNAIATGLLDYTEALTANTHLLEKLQVESGSNDTKVQNDLGVQVSMSESVALAVAYQIIYHTDPAVGFSKYDRLTTLNLVYNLK